MTARHTLVPSTLDDERLDQLRFYLIREATAAPGATSPAPRRAHGHRLVAAGAAVVLTAGVVAAGTVLAGGPGGTPSAEAAIAIEQEDGWTTIRLVDPNASAQAVFAEMEAAGIDAHIESIQRNVEGSPVIAVDPERPDGSFLSVLNSDGPVGLTVVLPPGLEPDELPATPGDPTHTTVTTPGAGAPASPDDTVAPVQVDAEGFEADLEAAGIRLGDDSISIRNDAGHEVIVLAIE